MTGVQTCALPISKTKADVDKLGMALAKLAEEDPTFQVRTDEASGQTIISGMGELHLDIIVDRLKREFKVEVNEGQPQVEYKEAITDRKSTRLNSSHITNSYAVFCLKKKTYIGCRKSKYADIFVQTSWTTVRHNS